MKNGVKTQLPSYDTAMVMVMIII